MGILNSLQEINDGGQEKNNSLQGFFKFPPSIGNGVGGFEIVEIPPGSNNKENEIIDSNGKRIIVRATSDMMKAAGYKAGSEKLKG